MSDAPVIRFACWQCGKAFEVSARSEGRIFPCSGCGAGNAALRGETPPSSGARERVRCPTCDRWVPRDAEECFNCGRPFRDARALEDFLEREPEVKASLARTLSETACDPPRSPFPWSYALLAAAALAALGAVVGFLVGASG